MKKKGAIELSIGTIVILVLAMSMLVLGMILVRNIFSGATNIANLNNEQIEKKMQEAYGEDRELAIYPNVNILEVKPGETSAFAVGIRNLLETSGSTNAKFEYDIELSGIEDCEATEKQILKEWMEGAGEQNIEIAYGKVYVSKVYMRIPEGTPHCSFKVIAKSRQNSKPYASEQMFIEIKA